MIVSEQLYETMKEITIEKAERRSTRTFIRAVLAGMFIAIGAYAAAVVSHQIPTYGIQKLIAGIVFPVGLILIMICGADLFTGNCLIFIAVLDKKVKLRRMLKNLFLVFCGNLLGSLIIAALIWGAGLLNNAELGQYALKVANSKVNLSFMQAFCSGIICNIVICMAVYGSFKSKELMGKVMYIWIVVFTFIITGTEHCVANMYYFIVALFAKLNPAFIEAAHLSEEAVSNINLLGIANNMIPVTLGNFVGGAVLVGMIYYFAMREKTFFKDKK